MLKLVLLAALTISAMQLHMTATYYNNLDAQNFIDGGEEGQRAYVQSITQGGKLVKCPFHAPYTTDGKTCIQCPEKTPLFNLLAKRCETCPGGIETFDKVAHKCK